jgi:hypothetical protein
LIAHVDPELQFFFCIRFTHDTVHSASKHCRERFNSSVLDSVEEIKTAKSIDDAVLQFFYIRFRVMILFTHL